MKIYLSILIFLVSLLTAKGQFHAVDTSFGMKGLTMIDIDTSINNADINAIELQGDGKIVGVGQKHASLVTFRLNTNGDLDSTFGNNGIISDSVIGFGNYDLGIQRDGKIVVLGIWGRMSAVRYNTNGTLDSSFSDSGYVRIQYTTKFGSPGFGSGASCIAIQPDGKILLGGYFVKSCPPLSGCKIGPALIRLLPNGYIDSSFGDAGRLFDTAAALTGFQPYEIAIQSNGRILMAGIGGRAGAVLPSLLAVDSSGYPDTTFGNNGYIDNSSFITGDYFTDIVVQSDDKFVVTGSLGFDYSLFRYNSNGKTWDTTYASSGAATISNIYGSTGHARAVDLNQKDEAVAVAWHITKWTKNGIIDSICDYGILTAGKDSIERITAKDVKIQSDGKILVAGSINKGSRQMAIMRFHKDWPRYFSGTQSDSVCKGFEFNGKSYWQSGIYLDTLTSIQGCDSVVSLNLTMKEVNVDVIQTGPNLVTTATNATYQWINCHTENPISGETNQSFTTTSNGSYAVIVTQDGCTDTSSCYEVTGVGIRELTSDDIHVYPNPSNGSFMIDIPKYPNTQITILNLQGSIIYQKQHTNKRKVEINLDAPKGIYFLQIKNETGLVTKKIAVH